MSNSTEPLSPEFLNAYRGEELVASAIAFIPIIVVAVALRQYCRHLSAVGWGVDDYLIILALFCQIGSSVLSICGVKYAGSGYHLAALAAKDPANISKFYKWLLADSFWYFLTVGIPKLGILFFYLRIFTATIYRKLVYLLIVIVASNLIVTAIISLNLCRPFAYNWDHSISGSCYDQVVFFEWASFPNILTDVAMLILPLPVVWKLHTSMKMKVGLTFTFLLGSIGLAASIVRFDEFFHGNAIEDGSWTVQLPIWTMVEPNTYLIAGCLMTYHPLIKNFRLISRHIKTTIFSSSGGRSSSGNTAQRIPSAEHDENKKRRKSLLGRRKIGIHDLESLGNTFDMQDTLHDSGGETIQNQDDIQLLRMKDVPGHGKDREVTESEWTPGQILVQNDYDVRSESREIMQTSLGQTRSSHERVGISVTPYQ